MVIFLLLSATARFWEEDFDEGNRFAKAYSCDSTGKTDYPQIVGRCATWPTWVWYYFVSCPRDSPYGFRRFPVRRNSARAIVLQLLAAIFRRRRCVAGARAEHRLRISLWLSADALLM